MMGRASLSFKFSATLAPLGGALLLAGCLAQQADLREVEQGLSGKLATVDKQEKELLKQQKDLQGSLKQARGDLDKLIADTRARLREEITTIREQELPRLQGKQEELDHRAGGLKSEMDDVKAGLGRAHKGLEVIDRIQRDQAELIKTDRDRGHADREQARAELGNLSEALKKLGQAVDDRLGAQERTMAAVQSKATEGVAHRIDVQNKEFSASLGEFRGALEKFKTVMAELESRVTKSDERVQLVDQRTKELSAVLDRDEKATTSHLSDVNKSIGSIKKTVETLGDGLSAREQEQGRRLDEMHKYAASIGKMVEAVGDKLTVRAQEQDRRLDELGKQTTALVKSVETFSTSPGEFRGALEKFKNVMAEIESRVNKSDERVQLADQRTKELSAVLDRDEKATTKHLADVNKSVASITKTVVETLEGRLSARDQEQERRLDEMNKYVASIVKTVETVGDKLTARAQEQEQRLNEFEKGLVAVNGQVAGLAQDFRQFRGKADSAPAGPSAKERKSVGSASPGPERAIISGAAPEPSGMTEARSAALSTGPVGSQEQENVSAVVALDEHKEGSPASRSGKEVYEEVYQRFKQGHLDAACQGFTDFLLLYPSSDLAPNAQYWLGECFYGRKDFKRAIDAFGRVRTAYPTSEKVPAAMLKEGFAYLALKDARRGSTLLKQVVDGFPKSPEAGKASVKLSQINVSP